MPNFKCKEITPFILPFKSEGVEFHALYKQSEAELYLLYTSFENESFFLQISLKNGFFLIKADKHSKPTQVGLVQKALGVFKKHFCKKITNEAIQLKPTRLLAKNVLLQNDIEAITSKMKEFKGVFVEIGFGSGRYLLYQAENNPETLILGIELYTPSIEQVAKLAKVRNVDNVILSQNDARVLFELLPNQSVDKVFLHFPVPWSGQDGRKIISANFIKTLFEVLKTGGKFELRTDDKEYFNYTLALFLQKQKARLEIAKNASLKIISKYEARWQKQGKDIYDLSAFKLDESTAKKEQESFALCEFDEKNLQNFALNFHKDKIKGEDYFISLEALYQVTQKDINFKNLKPDLKQEFIIKLAFGSFDKPSHSYLLLKPSHTSFLCKKPLPSPSNIKALKDLPNFFKNSYHSKNRSG